MIIGVTGVILTPGNNGNDCLGNGEHFDQNGKLIKICCDECNYALCCLKDACKNCKLEHCIREETSTLL